MEETTVKNMPTHYESVFAKNPEGKVVLEHLHRLYYDPPTKLPLDALDLAFKAGQRDVVRFITIMRDRKQREVTDE